MNTDRVAGWIFTAIVIGMLAMIASGCSTTGRSCPDVPRYSPGFTAAFTEQYASTVPAGSPLDTFIIDARRLRAEARACK